MAAPARTSRALVPPLAPFLVVSLALHAVAFRATHGAMNEAAPAFDSSAQTLAGDTLDVEPAPVPVDGEEEEEPAPAVTGQAATPAPAAPAVPAFQRSASRSAASHAAPSPAVTAAPALFGAVGVRFASDLATTFTRAFPQAASADPVWPTVPFGSAGSATLKLTLDEEGHLEHADVSGAPSVALRRGIDRTLTLIGHGRSFTAHGAVTTLRITARVSRDDVHDGMHGDVFALSGGSFAGDVGNAFFALPPTDGPGRRVDLELRLLP